MKKPPPRPVGRVILPPLDRFGLQRFGASLLGSLTTPGEHERQCREVTDLVREVFDAAARVLGDAQARKLFIEVSRRPRGAPKGPRNPARDRELLAALRDKGSVSKAAKAAHDPSNEVVKGQSIEANQKHLRRKSAEKYARDRQVDADTRRTCAFMRKFGMNMKSILGDTDTK